MSILNTKYEGSVYIISKSYSPLQHDIYKRDKLQTVSALSSDKCHVDPLQ